MSDLVTRAQIDVLADCLGVPPDRLRHLERLAADGVRALRERISDTLFDEQAATFSRISRLAPLVPNSMVAKVSEAIVPPLVAGRAAGALGVDHPGRIPDLLSRLSPGYMADCAPYLDRRAIAMLAPVAPGKTLVPAANELMRRRAYVTAAQFLDHATPQLIDDFESGIDDDEGILLTAALTPATERLGEIIRRLPAERLARIVKSAARSTEATLAGLSLLSRLDRELTASLGAALFDSLDDDELDVVLTTVIEHDATAELRTVAAAVPAEARARLAARPALADLRPELSPSS